MFLYLLIAQVPWLSIPILHAGYPNQFLFQIPIIAYLLGERLRGPLLTSDVNRHPFYLPYAYAITLGLGTWIFFLVDLQKTLSIIIQPTALIKSICQNIFLWDPYNPIHPLAILLSFSLLLSLVDLILRSQVSRKQLLSCICWASLPVYAYAYTQALVPTMVSLEAITGIGGTFQNGNLLSFYAAIILLCSLYTRNYPIAALSLLPIYWGQGRLSHLALALIFIPKIFQRNWLPLGLSWLFFGGASYVYTNGAPLNFLKNIFCQIYDEFFYNNDRLAHYKLVWQSFLEQGFGGVGLGRYFSIAADGKEIHNLFLRWGVELGWGAIAVIVLACWQFRLRIPTQLRQVFIVLFFGLMGDHYLSSPEIAMLVAVFLAACMINNRISTAPNLLIPTVILAVFSILFSFKQGPTWLALNKHYTTEVDPQGQAFNWNSSVFNTSWPQACMQIEMNTFASTATDIILGLNCQSDKFQTLSELKLIESKLMAKQEVRLKPGWQVFCLCKPKQNTCQLYSRAKSSRIPAWENRHPRYGDSRLLGFALRNSPTDCNGAKPGIKISLRPYTGSDI